MTKTSRRDLGKVRQKVVGGEIKGSGGLVGWSVAELEEMSRADSGKGLGQTKGVEGLQSQCRGQARGEYRADFGEGSRED